jgi:hypothetical protein
MEPKRRSIRLTFLGTGEAVVAELLDDEAPSVCQAVKSYLGDLKGTLDRDTDHARMLLERLVGKIILRRDGNHLVAEFAANLPGILDLEDFGEYGAGRASSTEFATPLLRTKVA